MPNYQRRIVYLSDLQCRELFQNETITVDGVTIEYSDNDMYVTPQQEPYIKPSSGIPASDLADGILPPIATISETQAIIDEYVEDIDGEVYVYPLKFSRYIGTNGGFTSAPYVFSNIVDAYTSGNNVVLHLYMSDAGSTESQSVYFTIIGFDPSLQEIHIDIDQSILAQPYVDENGYIIFELEGY